MDSIDYRHHSKALSFYSRLRQCNDSYIKEQLNSALDSLGDALRLYSSDQLLSSYNGGKDADVVMHLLRAAVAKYSADNSTIYHPRLVYFAVDDEFSEVLEHIKCSEELFDLQVKRYSCGIIEGIKAHAEANKGCGKQAPAFVLGTRKGDPNCGQQETFTPSSPWMPVAFMRVNPIITWTYGQVWHFLRIFNLPYCKLYDNGYTSLGPRALTLRNPLLKKSSGCYWPAYMLTEWSYERAGRLSKNAVTQTLATTSTTAKSSSQTTDESLSPDDTSIVSGGADVTVGIILVGDDLYNTQESYLQGTITALSKVGAGLKAMTIVNENINEISEEVQRLSQKCDIVVTCGGIGESLGDFALRGVALGLSKGMEECSQLSDNINKESENNADTPTISDVDSVSCSRSVEGKLMIPRGTQLHFPTLDAKWPILQCDNVFMLKDQDFSIQMSIIARQYLIKSKKVETMKIIMKKFEELSNLLTALINGRSDITLEISDCLEDQTICIVTFKGNEPFSMETVVSELLNKVSDDIIVRAEK